jgi:hypothetical protein
MYQAICSCLRSLFRAFPFPDPTIFRGTFSLFRCTGKTSKLSIDRNSLCGISATIADGKSRIFPVISQ